VEKTLRLSPTGFSFRLLHFLQKGLVGDASLSFWAITRFARDRALPRFRYAQDGYAAFPIACPKPPLFASLSFDKY
jgi:hypothetical protein